MDEENNAGVEELQLYDSILENLDKANMFISEEDLKIQDYTKLEKKEQINRNYDFLFSEKESDRIHKLVNKYYTQLTTKGERIKAIVTGLRLRFIEK